ncbi:uncharacterized protein EV154DRAFT_33959 [Mucor mucedo]|uniref:uncharacterized protein n=1 Tax=Mucor mucedo TaxID=29922 RepID=UPI00221F2B51|nr:uncharacterized protein EV154DRAFT_33959 [Mucor mucedo]KAI7895120.1 hypothetical protein EV154DRAFT_33959 [Mucor mucedo]
MGCFEKGPSMEAGGGINERMEVSSSEKRTIFDQDQAHDVILFDISCNKKWAAYVTYQKSKLTKDSNVTNENNEERIFITRRKFYEVDQKHPSYYEAEPTEPSVVEHFSLEITEHVKNAGLNHCKFLSVSPDGEYVVMSFFERNMIGEIPKIKEPENKHCLIFEVQDNKNLRLKDKIICDGRAVFIGNETYQLAIISTNVVEVYAKFPGNLSVTDVYDLSPFLSGKQQHEELRKDDLYIQNASWADIVTHSENADIKRIMMLSRHIRHNIVTTHFVGNIARVWSIAEDGVRFTSFRAKEENIVAFSKNYKYTATHLENTKSINIYNVKSGLLVYRLKSQAKWSPEFKVSHIRFCYGGRYVAMSGIEGDNVSFEVWYIEAEKSIYRKTIQAKTSLGLTRCKIVYPFVTRGTNENGIKCLKGIYTCFENDKAITGFVELKIDQKAEIDWQTGQRQPYRGGNFEIYNNLGDFNGLKGAYIEADKKECMIRFGQHTVQLWKLAEGRNQKNSPITDEDELLYIRAYKGPDYGVEYSFRENWQIHDFNSIRFIQGEPSGRVLVNITENKDNQSDSTYHTEELFLPLEEPASKPGTPCFELSTTMDLDSAQENNRDMLLSKTEAIIKSAVKDIHKESNFFSTISGSRTLAMLASFESGREIIKLIIAKELPISIFSDPRYVKDVGIEDDEQFWIDQRQRALEFWVDQKQKLF